VPTHESTGRLTGLYPTKSRTELSAWTGLHISAVSSILMGRRPVKLKLAIEMSKAIGVSVEEFSAALERQRREFRKWERVKAAQQKEQA
jgi:hypothetical protein